MTYNEFRDQVQDDNVEAVTISGNRVEGAFSDPVAVGPDDGSEVDSEIMETLQNAYERSRQTLEEHRGALDSLAERLLEEEEVPGEEVEKILRTGA